VGSRVAGPEERAEDSNEHAHRPLVDATSLEANTIDRAYHGAVASGDDEGRHITFYKGAAGQERGLTDPRERCDGDVSCSDRMRADDDVSAEQRAIGERDGLAHPHVMGDVSTDHEQAAIADKGEPATLRRATVHGDVLAEHVVVTDDKAGGPPVVVTVLGVGAEHGEWVDDIAQAEGGGAEDRALAEQTAASADSHMSTDDRQGPDDDIVIEHRIRMHDGGGVDAGSRRRR
jgi:hypothetical protein